MKIIYCYLVLDILHKGHLVHIMNAKSSVKDGLLVMGVLTDKAVMEKKPKPLMSFDERMDIARATNHDGMVVPQDTYSPLSNIRNIKPDVMLESSSHNPDDIEEVRKAVEGYGGRLIILPYYPEHSSTDYKNKIKNGGIENEERQTS